MESLSEWRLRVLGYCGDHAATNFGAQGTDTQEVIRALNDAMYQVAQTITDASRYYYYTRYDFSTIVNGESYALPPDFWRSLGLEDREGASASEHGVDFAYNVPEGRYSERGWDIRAQKLYLHDIPGSAITNKYRLHYLRRPAAMSYGTAAAGATNSITLAATPTYGSSKNINDYYNHSRILIISGTGAGTIAEIIDYDGGTRVCTTDTGAFGATSVYSVLPDIPEIADRLVCVKAAIGLLSRVEAPNIDYLMRLERQDALRLVSLMERRGTPITPAMRMVSW